MDIGEKIKALRKSNNKSQEELALDIGVSRQTVNKWETNKAQPSTENLLLICSIFEVSADYFLDSEKIESEETKDETNISTWKNKRKRTLLIIGAVVCAILFLISALWTIIFGFVAFTTNVGYVPVGTDDVDVSEFCVMLVLSIVLLVFETLILLTIFRNRQNTTRVETKTNKKSFNEQFK